MSNGRFCRGKRGTPITMNDEIPAVSTRDLLIKQLREENARLKEGACRFNCRTQRDAFMAGFEAAATNIGFNAVSDILSEVEVCAEQHYKQWKSHNQERKTP